MRSPRMRTMALTEALAALALLGAIGVWLAQEGNPSARADPGRTPDQERKQPASDPRPVEASEAILNAFDKYRVVALGEAHGLQEEHDFIQSVIRTPAFAATVDDIVVECGNALYQDILDRYIAGQDVPMAEVGQVWRNTTQSPFGPSDAPVYEQLFTTVREVNQKLPGTKRVRVLAGDPPIDWKSVRSRSDAARFLGQRDTHFASVVKQHVLAKNRKALLIMGMEHLFKARPRVGASQNVVTLLEESYPGSTLVVMPHTGFGNWTPELAHLNAELEPRLAAWPKPSLVLLKDTWLATLETRAIVPPIIGPGGRSQDPYAGLTLADTADAYLYLGRRDALTRSNPSPETFKDQDYLEELDRRSRIRFGQPFDPQRLTRFGRQFYDGNARPLKPAFSPVAQTMQVLGLLRFGPTLLMLLKYKPVQDELRLTEAQIVLLEQAAQNEMKALNEFFSLPDIQVKRLQELVKESDQTATKILNPGPATELRCYGDQCSYEAAVMKSPSVKAAAEVTCLAGWAGAGAGGGGRGVTLAAGITR